MLAALIALLKAILPMIFKGGPSKEAVAEAHAAAAETNLATERQANAEVQAAVQARAAVDAVPDSKLRDPDPFERAD